jgi:predicted PurR-regulated permease PerM
VSSSDAPTPAGPREPWSQQTKDRWFFGILAVSAGAVAYLFSPFLYVLLFASVVVVVAWPLFERILRSCDGRRGVAALLTVVVLAVALFVPLGFLVYRFVEQAVAIVGMAGEYVQSGAFAERLAYLSESTEWMPTWVRRWLPADFDLMHTVARPLEQGALGVLNAIGTAVPGLLGGTMSAVISFILFLFAVVTLFMEGPRALQMIANLSPLDDAYERRLFGVFSEFANNVVVGTLATAVVQGTVAGLGYAIVGVDRVVFFAMLTGVFSFVPLFGTVVIWVPLSIVTAFEHGLPWGLFLVAWGVLVAHLDNFIRPLFMRGRTNIHPLLIFLGVFGGLAWMGVPGALVGPVIVVFFFAMYTIYAEDYLGIESPAIVTPAGQDWLPRWARRLVRRGRNSLEAAGIRKAGQVEPMEPDAPTLGDRPSGAR